MYPSIEKSMEGFFYEKLKVKDGPICFIPYCTVAATWSLWQQVDN
jgi:hypothetical protein